MNRDERVLNQAHTLFRQGKLPQAELLCFRALEDQPELQSAWRLLGMIGLRDRAPGIAALRLERAIQLDRDCLESRLMLAEAYRHLGEFDKCRNLIEATLKSHGHSPAVPNEAGLLCLAIRDAEEAEAEFQRALQIEPNFVPALTNLAELLRGNGRASEAIAMYRRIVELAPSPQVLNNLGGILAEQRKYEEAFQCFQRVAKEWPSFADATHNLGLLHHELGDATEACRWLRETIQRNPNFVHAYSTFVTYYPERLDEHELRAIDNLLSKKDLPAEQRASLLFARGRWFDTRKVFDRAARDIKTAHTLKSNLLTQQKRLYVPESYEAQVSAVIHAFNRQHFDRITGWGLETEVPVFVIGLQRSGTSLIEQILASHPQVHGAGEVRYVPNGFASLPGILGKQGQSPDHISLLDRQQLLQAAEYHLDKLQQLNPSAHRIVDKLPENYLHVGWIRSLFPKARIIHCCRDLRDIAISCWLTRFQSDAWTHNAEHLLSRVRQYLRIIQHWKEVGVSLFEVRYEDVVADPERWIRKVVEHIGLDWHSSCLEFHKTRRPVRTASASQVRRPIYSDSLSRWKHYEQVLPGLFEELERLQN